MKRSKVLALLSILVLAFWLRLWIDGSAIPGRTFLRNDEGHYLDLARSFLNGQLGVHYFINPTLYGYLLAATTAAFGALRRVLGLESGFDVFVARETMAPCAILLAGRCLSIAASALSVLVVARIGRKLFSPEVGLLAGLALALDGLAQSRAPLCGNESLMLLLGLAAIDSLLGGTGGEPSCRRRFFAGVLLGLATATKYSAGILAIPFAIALGRRVPLAVLGAATGFFAGCPMALLNFDDFMNDFLRQAGFLHAGYRETDVLDREVGFLYYLRTFDFTHHGLVFAIVCAAGILGSIACAVHRSAANHRILLSSSLPLYLFLGTGIFHHERFLLPSVPFILLHGAWMIEHLARRASALLQARPWAATSIACAALLVSSLPTVIDHQRTLERWYGSPDVQSELFEKVRGHLSPDDRVIELAIRPAENLLIEDDVRRILGWTSPPTAAWAEASRQLRDELRLLPGSTALRPRLKEMSGLQDVVKLIADHRATAFVLQVHSPLRPTLESKLRVHEFGDELIDWLLSLRRRAVYTSSDGSMVAAVLDLKAVN